MDLKALVAEFSPGNRKRRVMVTAGSTLSSWRGEFDCQYFITTSFRR